MFRALQALTLVATLAVFASANAGDPAQQAAAPTPAASKSSNSESLAEVTVTAKRELARQVRKFVDQISTSENGGSSGLARWDVPSVCPLVSGLPKQDGEYILERLSQIGRVAGIPLADEHCRPNLYILVTPMPQGLLKAMEKRDRRFTFGYDPSYFPPVETPASIVEEFINKPRAVKVWYNSDEKDYWGKPVGFCPASVMIQAGCPKTICLPGTYVRCDSSVAGGSHLWFNTRWAFSRVFVVVDRERLHGVKLGQLADYVAMVSFAKLKPDARVGNAPTILKLFDGAPQAAPTGMTDWDQSFLKSLYATQQTSMVQRSQISRAMVREMAH